MSIFNKNYQVTKAFQRLGIWSIPLLSTPLLLPLVLAQSLSPSSHNVNTYNNTSTNQSSRNISNVSQWEQQVIPKVINKTNKNNWTNKSNQPKTHPTAPQPQLLAKKQSKTVRHRKRKIAKKPQYTPPAFEIRVAIADGVDSLTIGSDRRAHV